VRTSRDPLAATCLAITVANDSFMSRRLRSLYFESLLRRTDWMLDRLEQLNLMDAHRVPYSARLELSAVVAALPFEYHAALDDEASPTAGIDLVFDLQQALLSFMTGVKPDETDGEEVAS
jgi:hypothetical protein